MVLIKKVRQDFVEKWHLSRDGKNESELVRQREDRRVFLEEETTYAKKLWQKRREQVLETVKTWALKGGGYSSRWNGRAK